MISDCLWFATIKIPWCIKTCKLILLSCMFYQSDEEWRWNITLTRIQLLMRLKDFEKVCQALWFLFCVPQIIIVITIVVASAFSLLSDAEKVRSRFASNYFLTVSHPSKNNDHANHQRTQFDEGNSEFSDSEVDAQSIFEVINFKIFEFPNICVTLDKISTTNPPNKLFI